MTTAATSLLGLALPVTGELSGTWGDVVNNSLTSLLDTAIAGTTTISTDADVTLTTTTLASNQARQAILLCSGARTAARNITAPAQSKIYTVINATTGGYSVVIRGVGPTTGVTVPSGQSIQVAWNGSDFVDVSNSFAATGTANGVVYLNASKVPTTGTALVFDGSSLGIGITPSTVAGAWKTLELVNAGSCLAGGYGEIDLANNLKYDRVGAFSYVTTGYASRFVQIGGVFTWNSGTGTAGAAASLATQMQLDAVGNLGVGGAPTSGWFASYKVIQLGTFGNWFTNNDHVTWSNNSFVDSAGIDKYANNDYASMYRQVNGQHQFYYAATGTAGSAISFTQGLTLSNGGNLGLGTTSPSNRLTIEGTTAATQSILINAGGNAATQLAMANGFGARQGVVFASNGSTGYTSFGMISENTALTFKTAAYNVSASSDLTTGWTERARFDASGNFMVGASTGESKFSVFSGGSNGFTSGTLPPGITIYGAAGNGYGSMLSFKAESGDQGVSGIGAFRTSGYQTDLRFYTNSTTSANSFSERMRITPAGYVGIGITNPEAYCKLIVSGKIAATDSANYVNSLYDSYYSYSGFWQNAVAVPADGAYHWCPIVGGAAVTSGAGYVTQAVFGVKKYGGNSFAVGAYIGVTYNADGGLGREFIFDTGGNFSAPGSKSFRIPHPLHEKAETHELWHVALEGPSLDLIYRGTVDLVAGQAEVNIDAVSRMTEGTFVALTKDAQAFTSNESDWVPVRGSVNGNILSIEAQDNTATSKVSWMVIAKRKDPGALTECTVDENGEFITERAVLPE